MKKFPLFLLALACLAMTLSFVSCDPNDDDDNDAMTLVCLGDSLTAGMSATVVGEDDAAHSYPAYLQAYLDEAEAETAITFSVINAGESGDTAAEGSARLSTDVLAKDPDVVIVCLGANDLLSLGSSASAADFSDALETMGENLTAIVDSLDDGTRKVLLAKFYTEEAAQGLLDYNQITAITADQFVDACDQVFSGIKADASENVVLVEDIWSGVWGVDGMMSDDGIHPTAAGYAAMAENYLDALGTFFE